MSSSEGGSAKSDGQAATQAALDVELVQRRSPDCRSNRAFLHHTNANANSNTSTTSTKHNNDNNANSETKPHTEDNSQPIQPLFNLNLNVRAVNVVTRSSLSLNEPLLADITRPHTPPPQLQLQPRSQQLRASSAAAAAAASSSCSSGGGNCKDGMDKWSEGESEWAGIPSGYVLIDARPYQWQPPPDQPAHPYRPHQGAGSQYLRDFILGINDGLITTLLLVVSMVGGGSSSMSVLLAAISCAVAGAISMGLGEYVATKSQREVVEGEKRTELEHLRFHREVEIAQLRCYLASIGIDGPLLHACVRKIGTNDEFLMKIMEKFEFGQEASEELQRNPFTAMFMSGRLFFLGAIPSVISFVQPDPYRGLYIACSLCSVCLFLVGVYKTRTTGGNPWRGGLELLAIGVISAGFAYACGLAYDAARGQ